MEISTDYEFLRLFTVTEAESSLPLVRSIVHDILLLGDQLRAVISGERSTLSIEELQEQLNDFVTELSSMGCYYKDWNFQTGLVDFPALLDGEIVFLCWRSDEPNLRYFHKIEDGYSGRRPLSKN